MNEFNPMGGRLAFLQKIGLTASQCSSPFKHTETILFLVENNSGDFSVLSRWLLGVFSVDLVLPEKQQRNSR